MPQRQSHPRIHPKNYPLLDRYDSQHPAVRALQVQAEARDVCVGKEIEWPQAKTSPIEQHWYSSLRNKRQSFSSIAYEFISYDLVLDGWLSMASEPTANEAGFLLKDCPALEELLEECEAAARADRNNAMLPLIAKAREYIEAHRSAILQRFLECGIGWSEKVE